MTIETNTLRKRQNARGDVRRERILDTAEKLFALNSYEGVSMRDIATETDTKLGTLVHHFPTKENIFVAVLARRNEEWCSILRERLRALLRTKSRLTVADILGVFASRVFEVARTDNSGERYNLQILVQRVPLESDQLHPLIAANYKPVRQLYLRELRKLCPNIPRLSLDRAFSLFELSFGAALFSPMQKHFAIEYLGAAKLRQLEKEHVTLFSAGIEAIAKQYA